MDLLRKTRAVVNLDHIQHNLLALQATMAPGVKVAAVVKANAYGHDIVTITELLLEYTDYIAVATLQEAVQLRKNFAQANILVMGYTPDDQLDYVVDFGITQTIFSLVQAQIISRRAQATGKKARIHVKVDTGFNRLGYSNHHLAQKEIIAMTQLPGLEIEGMFSHLALKNAQSDEDQYQRLIALSDKLEAQGVSIPIKHICDSIGAVAYPQYRMDMVRLGSLIYGYCSRKTSFQLKPAMTLYTEVAMVKIIAPGEGVSYDYRFVAEADTQIATLPVGYADGIPRNIWLHGHVMINGQQARFVGLPCMDQCMVDVTGLEVNVGDEVVFFGGEGDNELHLDNLSKWCDTNKNELLTRISMRVPRVYFRNGNLAKVVDYLGE